MLKKLFAAPVLTVDDILKQHTQTIEALKKRSEGMNDLSYMIEGEIALLKETLDSVINEKKRADSISEAMNQIFVS